MPEQYISIHFKDGHGEQIFQTIFDKYDDFTLVGHFNDIVKRKRAGELDYLSGRLYLDLTQICSMSVSE